MRICLLTPSFLPSVGGMEVVVDKLARNFLARGHQPVVVAKAPRPHLGPPPPLPYPLVHYRRTRSAVWLLGPARRALRDEHARQPFDVIHAHMIYPSGYVAWQVGARLGVPVILTSHKGDIVPESRFRQRWLTRRRMVRAMIGAQAVTGVSRALQGIIDELTGGKARSATIVNGVDLPPPPPPAPPAAFAPLAGRPYMLSLCRLHVDKGLDVLLDALALLRDRRANPPPLVIAGEGKVKDQLQEQARRLRLEHVTFAGLVLGADKDWLMHHCAFFVQPSRVEGMPLTVLEAMAYSKSVLGTDIGGIRELVADGRNGLLVPPENPAALADGLLKLAAHPCRAEMESAALETAKAYSWPAIADQYLSLFASLLRT